MKRPEGSPHQSHHVPDVRAKAPHMYRSINHIQTNNVTLSLMQKDPTETWILMHDSKKSLLFLFKKDILKRNQIRQWRMKHDDFTIKLSPLKKGDIPRTPTHPPTAVYDRPVETKGKTVSLHEQLKQQHLTSLCPEGSSVMGPPVNNAQAFPQFTGHTRAGTLSFPEKQRWYWPLNICTN